MLDIQQLRLSIGIVCMITGLVGIWFDKDFGWHVWTTGIIIIVIAWRY